MKVRMKVAISGTLDGVPYPAYGEVGDFDDAVAERLVEKGLAEPTTTRSVRPIEETEAKETHDEVHQTYVEERPAANLSVEARPAITRTAQKTTSKTAAKKRK